MKKISQKFVIIFLLIISFGFLGFLSYNEANKNSYFNENNNIVYVYNIDKNNENSNKDIVKNINIVDNGIISFEEKEEDKGLETWMIIVIVIIVVDVIAAIVGTIFYLKYKKKKNSQINKRFLL